MYSYRVNKIKKEYKADWNATNLVQKITYALTKAKQTHGESLRGDALHKYQ